MHIYKAAAADIGPSGQALVINSLRVTGGSWNREAITAYAFTELLPLISAPHGKKTLYHSRVHTDLALGTSPFIGFEKKKTCHWLHPCYPRSRRMSPPLAGGPAPAKPTAPARRPAATVEPKAL